MNICQVEHCDRPVRNKTLGLCDGHYARTRRGAPLEGPFQIKTPKDQHGPCQVDGCDEPWESRGYCDGHYQRWRDGKPVDVPLQAKVRSDGRCRVPECSRPHWSTGLCDLHYQRQRAGQDLGNAESMRPRLGLDACTVDGCTRPYRARGYCATHLRRLYVDADLNTPVKPWARGEVLGYGRAHELIVEQRGRADTYRCVDCGKRAREWSLDNDTPRSITNPAGLRYSLTAEDYSPRCTACHQSYDYRWLAAHGRGR